MGLLDIIKKLAEPATRAAELTAENAPLIAHHNLSREGVKVASDIGGIPMPSLAVSRADYPLTNFGDITLLADPSTIAPSRRTSIWPTDVYTGRQPRGDLEFANDKSATAALKADPNFATIRDIGYYMDATNGFGEADRMMREAQVGIANGIDPRGYTDFFSYTRDVRRKLGGYVPEEQLAAVPGLAHYGEVSRVLYPSDLFTASGNRRKPSPYTLDAVMKRMSSEKAYAPGSERMFGQSPGAFRALATPPFKSLDEVKAARGSIWPSEAVDETKSAFTDAYQSLLDDLVSASGKRGDWGIINEAADAMNEIASGKNPSWFTGATPENVIGVKELRALARQMPTEYFEAKTREALPLSSFKGAIAPAGDSETIDALKRAGIENVLTYATPEERVALFKRFPELLFSAGGAAVGAGLLANPKQAQANEITPAQEAELMKLMKAGY